MAKKPRGRSCLQPFNCAKRKGLKHSIFLVWTGIRQAIPPEIKRLELNENELWSLEFQRGEKLFNPLTSKSKHFYELPISKNS